MSSTPLVLMLEFARAEQGGDPFAFRFDTQEYLVRSEGGAFKGARFPWDSQLLDDLQGLRRPGRDPSLLQHIGLLLRRFLESTKWTQDEARILDAVKEGRRVLVSLRSAAAELYALPWELLVIESTGQHIGELPGVLLRYEWPDTRSIPASQAHSAGAKILVAWSAAAGAVPASEHVAAIQRADPQETASFDATRDVLAAASCRRLSSVLSAATKERRPVAILHLLAHGSGVGNTLGVALDSDEPGGPAVVVDAGRLRQLLAPHAATLRLVVLAACDSGNEGAIGNQLGSIAQALHRAGIAAVVASRFPLSVSGANRLAEALYAELRTGDGSLESALLQARLRLAEDATQLDWASLQLYARAADGAETRPLAPAKEGARSAAAGTGLRLGRMMGAMFSILLAAGAGFAWWRSAHPAPKSVPAEAAPIVTTRTPEPAPPPPDLAVHTAARPPDLAAASSPEPVSAPKAAAFRGVILHKRTQDPIDRISVTLVATRCRTKTDQFGVFDFSSCTDQGMFRLKNPKVRLDFAAAAMLSSPVCNDIPLRRDAQEVTRIDIGKNCKFSSVEALP